VLRLVLVWDIVHYVLLKHRPEVCAILLDVLVSNWLWNLNWEDFFFKRRRF